MENSARIVCILAPSIRHARIPETPDRRRATASLRTLRNARRTNDIILTTSIPSLPNCSANSSRLSSRRRRDFPSPSSSSVTPSSRIGEENAWPWSRNERRYSRLDASRLGSRSAAILETRLLRGGCLNKTRLHNCL